MLRFNHELFSKQLRQEMLRYSLSYRKLANSCNLSHATIYRIANDSKNIKVEDAILLCHVLDMNFYEFIEDNWVQREMF